MKTEPSTRGEQVILKILDLPTLPAWDASAWCVWLSELGYDQSATKSIYLIYANLDHNRHWTLRTAYVEALFCTADQAFAVLITQPQVKYDVHLKRLRQILSLIAQLDYIHVSRERWMLKVRGWYDIATLPRWAPILKALTFPAFVEWGTPRLTMIETALTCPALASYAFGTLLEYARHDMRKGLKDIVSGYLVELIQAMVRLDYPTVIDRCFAVLREYADGFDIDGFLPLLNRYLTPEELDIARGHALLHGFTIGRLVSYSVPPVTTGTLMIDETHLREAQNALKLTHCLQCGTPLQELEGYLWQQIPEEGHLWHHDQYFRCPRCPIAWTEVRTYEDIEAQANRIFVQAYDLKGDNGALLPDRLYLGDRYAAKSAARSKE